MCIFTKTNHIHPIPAPCSMKPSRIKPRTEVALVQLRHPHILKAIRQEFEPMLTNVKHIPAIHAKIVELYPELDRTDEAIMCAACVYQAYSPATLISAGLDRAPNGVRQEICKVMNWNHATSVNEAQASARSYCKGAASVAFLPKVNAVLMGFERFSVKDNQLDLGL